MTGEARCAWLTTLRADGSPHTTPVWFVLRDDTFWIGSAEVNVKVRNLVRDPRVSLAIDGSAASPSVAQGSALVHRSPASHGEVVAAFARKYDGWDATDPTRDDPRVLIEVSVDRWLLRGA